MRTVKFSFITTTGPTTALTMWRTILLTPSSGRGRFSAGRLRRTVLSCRMARGSQLPHRKSMTRPQLIRFPRDIRSCRMRLETAASSRRISRTSALRPVRALSSSTAAARRRQTRRIPATRRPRRRPLLISRRRRMAMKISWITIPTTRHRRSALLPSELGRVRRR